MEQAYFKTRQHEIFIDKVDETYIVEIFDNENNRLIDKASISTYISAYLYVSKKYLKENVN